MKKPSKTVLKKRADALFRQLVRARGRCELAGTTGFACSMTLQTCHALPRRYLSIRWTEWNAYAGCGAHHVWFTHHPAAWALLLRDRWGDDLYWQRLQEAEAASGAPDYPAVIAGLEEAVQAQERGQDERKPPDSEEPGGWV